MTMGTRPQARYRTIGLFVWIGIAMFTLSIAAFEGWALAQGAGWGRTPGLLMSLAATYSALRNARYFWLRRKKP